MDWMPWLVALSALACAGASFFFALAETALFALGRWQVAQLPQRFPHSGALVVRLLGTPSELLATIVLGNTLANALFVALGMSVHLAGRLHLAIALPLLFLLLLVVCEVLPKTLALRAPERWAVWVSRPMWLALRVATPIERLVRWVNDLVLNRLVARGFKPLAPSPDDEYRELLDLAFQQGTLRQGEREIILEIIGLDQKTAGDVMTPRAQMACIPDNLTPAEMIAAARRLQHRRLPLFDETPDTIVGVLDTKQLLFHPDDDIIDAIELASFVPRSMNLLQLFHSLQRQKGGLVIVLDEYGSVAGLVTMEDIIEEILGEITNEAKSESYLLERTGPGTWRVGGGTRIEDFQRECPDLPAVEGVQTVGGLMLHALEVVPSVGETTVVGGFRLTALAADDRRVREVLVESQRRR